MIKLLKRKIKKQQTIKNKKRGITIIDMGAENE